MNAVTIAQLAKSHDAGDLVVDVREPHEYAAGHIAGALLIPLGVVPVRLHELPTDSRVYVVCRSGGRSAQAASAMTAAGIDARSVDGGTDAWADSGLPLRSGTGALPRGLTAPARRDR